MSDDQRRYLGFQFHEYESASVEQCHRAFSDREEALRWAAEPTGWVGAYREVLDTHTLEEVKR